MKLNENSSKSIPKNMNEEDLARSYFDTTVCNVCFKLDHVNRSSRTQAYYRK